MPFILCSPRNRPDFHVRINLYPTQTFLPFLFPHQVWMAGGLWNPLWGPSFDCILATTPKMDIFFSHSRWQIVLYIAESLHPCPIHWYMLTMLFIKPRRKWKISIIPRIRLAFISFNSKTIINEKEFCWRVWTRAFYLIFFLKQAWFPRTNKIILYSNAWRKWRSQNKNVVP